MNALARILAFAAPAVLTLAAYSAVWSPSHRLTGSPSAAQPDTVSLAPRFVAGQSVAYSLDAEFTRRRALRDDAPGTRLAQSADLTLLTVGVEPDGGATVRATFDRLRVRVEKLGADASTTTWEWRRAAEKPVTEGPDVRGLDEAYSALARSSIQMRLAPDGSLRTMEGLDRAHEALAASRDKDDPGATPLLGVFSPGGVGTFFEGFWAVSTGAGRTRPLRPAPGDEWKAVKSQPLPAGYQARATTTYRLERVRADLADISGSTVFEIVPPRTEPDPADPVPKIVEQSGRVEAVWDGAAGRIVRRTSERSFAWLATVAPAEREPIEVNDYTAARIEVKMADQPPPAR